ncbi:MAG: O-methyltransferase [Syntrophales bacterium]
MQSSIRRVPLHWIAAVLIGLSAWCGPAGRAHAQQQGRGGLDARVSRFLDDARGSWADLNVPYQDGKLLHDLIVQGTFRRILEIGTSTGHSTIWLAWAAAKTGGTVTTIEIDAQRHRRALANFTKAGVAPYVDARLGDAHRLVPSLSGPFDFIFCDADKEWLLRYFRDLEPKIVPGGCFTAHNVLWRGDSGIERFLAAVRGNREFQTRIERGSGEGISVSCRIPRPERGAPAPKP